MGILDVLRFIAAIMINNFLAFIELIVPPKRKSIKGESVLITGGGHGIGRELALEVAKFEATVVILDINKKGGEETAAEIKKNGGTAFAYECDITDTSKVREVATKVRKDVGEVNILINNAGILNGAPLLDLDEVGIRRTFEVNALAPFWMIREFLPNMISNNHGHILNVCSMASFSGTAHLIDYCSSKYAALGLSESLIEELNLHGHTGIKVSSLCPMFVDTGLVKQIEDNNLSPLLSPKEVARVAVDGMLRNYPVITVPTHLWLVLKIGHLFPRRTAQFMKSSFQIKIKPQYKKEN